jgi:hypothetical protein
MTVPYNQINLKTNCPGYPHYIKVSFHPAWRTVNKEKLFMVSPGFLAVIPTQSDTTLIFGDYPLWNFTSHASLLSLFMFLIL